MRERECVGERRERGVCRERESVRDERERERERERESQGVAFLSSSDLSHEIFSIKSVPLCMGIKPSLSAENL